MLRSLYVKDFAVVDEAEIGFGQGLTVVTGETGAGKSLLVDALLLLSGARAEATMVRHGCERAEVRGIDSPIAPTAQWLRDEELDETAPAPCAASCAEGSRAPGSTAGRSPAQLKAIGEGLVEIHGQHEPPLPTAAGNSPAGRVHRHEAERKASGRVHGAKPAHDRRPATGKIRPRGGSFEHQSPNSMRRLTRPSRCAGAEHRRRQRRPARSCAGLDLAPRRDGEAAGPRARALNTRRTAWPCSIRASPGWSNC